MDNGKIIPVVADNKNNIIRNKLNSFPDLESSHLCFDVIQFKIL